MDIHVNITETYLVSIASKLLLGSMLCRLSTTPTGSKLENQAGFQPSWYSIVKIFTPRKVEKKHTFRRPKIFGSLVLKTAFDLVDHKILRRFLSLKGASKKFVSFCQSQFNNRHRVHTGGDLSSQIIMRSSVCRGLSFSIILFSFIIEVAWKQLHLHLSSMALTFAQTGTCLI